MSNHTETTAVVNVIVLVIPVDGPVRIEQSLADLPTMQSHVKGDSEGPGYIESIGHHDGATAYGHEEAKFVHAPNPRAHRFLVENFGHNNFDQIHGPVIILGCGTDGDGADLPRDLASAAIDLWVGITIYGE
jgi:hypothetical protein